MLNLEKKEKILTTYQDDAGRWYAIDDIGFVFELKDVGRLIDGNKVFDFDGHLILIIKQKA